MNDDWKTYGKYLGFALPYTVPTGSSWGTAALANSSPTAISGNIPLWVTTNGATTASVVIGATTMNSVAMNMLSWPGDPFAPNEYLCKYCQWECEHVRGSGKEHCPNCYPFKNGGRKKPHKRQKICLGCHQGMLDIRGELKHKFSDLLSP
jgi:hypothetical protein